MILVNAAVEELMKADPQYVEVSDGTRIAAWVAGSGSRQTPVVWVHANGFSGRMWIPVIESLQCRHGTCHIVYDLRGQGTSSKPEPSVENYDWGLQAGDLKEVIAHLSQGRVDAVGHSMGAAIIALAAAGSPELFRSLVLFEPIIQIPDRVSLGDPGANPLVAQARRRRATFASLEACRQRLGGKPPYSFWDREVFEIYLETALIPAPESGGGAVSLACPPEIEAVNYMVGGMHDAYDKLPQITSTTLLLQGARSPKGGPLDASALVERIPGAIYDEVEDATHFAPFEAPRRFAENLCRFWSDRVER